MSSELVDLLSDLVAIDSVNPALVPGGAGEARIAEFVARWGREEGLAVETVGAPERPSVVLRARGSGGGRTLLLCGHLDTVNVEGMTDPHVPRVDGDRLHGRGAYDMKAGLAAALLAARDATRRGCSSPATSSSRRSPTRSTPASASRTCCKACARTRRS